MKITYKVAANILNQLNETHLTENHTGFVDCKYVYNALVIYITKDYISIYNNKFRIYYWQEMRRGLNFLANIVNTNEYLIMTKMRDKLLKSNIHIDEDTKKFLKDFEWAYTDIENVNGDIILDYTQKIKIKPDGYQIQGGGLALPQPNPPKTGSAVKSKDMK